MPREVPSDIFHQIENWNEAVRQQTHHRPLQQPPPSPRILRPRIVSRLKPSAEHSRALVPTSGNPRKRKAPVVKEGDSTGKKAKNMSGSTRNQKDPLKVNTEEKRPRGRPPKIKPPPILAAGKISNPPLPSKSKSRSPTKRGRSRATARPDASIELDYLEQCQPSVELLNLEQAENDGPIPSKTRSLYGKLDAVPSGCIPMELKVEHEREIQPSSRPKPDFYLPLEQTPYPADHLQTLKRLVNKVVKSTERNSRIPTFERQWGATTVVPLFNELEQWPGLKNCVSLNVESCPIEPLELRMTRPDGYPLEIATINTCDTGDNPLTTSRMVDWSVGLDVARADARVIKAAYNNMFDHDQSLNQSLTYIKDYPLMVDLELKKTYSDRDPRVQLAVWKAGAFEKMRYHGWDTSLPMPGITVTGSEWECFLFFVRDSGLIMLGPLKMGSTQSINGTFEIIYKLYLLMKWGSTEYETWFKEYILTWFQHKAAGTVAPDTGLTSLHI